MAVKVEDLVAELRLDVKNFKGQINNLSKQVDGASKKMSASVGSVSSAFSVLKTAIIGLGLGRLATSIVRTTMDFEKFNASLAAVTGNQQDARKEMQYITSLVRRMGLDFNTAADSYIKLAAAAKGTAINSQQVKDIFEAVSMASVALGLDAQTAQGALVAISQMMSKGKVTAEELRGQLGERLPGAMNIMAKALGVTLQELDKMMVSGELLASNVLPKFASELKNAYGQASQVETAMKAFNRLNTEWTLLKNMLGTSGIVGALSDAVEILTSFIGLLTGNEIAGANRNARNIAMIFVETARAIALATVKVAEFADKIGTGVKLAIAKAKLALEEYYLQKKVMERDEMRGKAWRDPSVLDPEVESLWDRVKAANKEVGRLMDELDRKSEPVKDSIKDINTEYDKWISKVYEVYNAALKAKAAQEESTRAGMYSYPTNETMTYKVPFGFESLSDVDEAVSKSVEAMKKLISERNKMTDATFQAEMDAAKYTAQASDMIIAEYEGRKNALIAEHQWEVNNKDLLNRQLIALEEQKQGELKRLREEEFKTGVAGAGAFFNDMMTLTAGHNKKMFRIAKAGAIATATINMAQGISEALKLGPILGPVLAAAQAAAFLVQLKRIQETEIQGYAMGGRPRAGVPAIVGERGPEMFIPDQPGTIVPNDKLGAMGSKTVNINFSINAVDSRGVSQVLQDQRNTIIGIIRKHMSDRGRTI